MSEYSAVVENIRGFLGAAYQIRGEEVLGWAEQYARLCREANERLRQCSDYLKKGLRAEAIHIADTAPNLLDMVAMLDMPELPDWKQACFRFELADAPALMLDTAAILNEAYAQAQPLDGLMAYHRLLALARAPIKNRLAIMRRLGEIDTSIAIWDDDIRVFERLRLEEIRTAVNAAARRGEAETINQARGELALKWQIDVPPDLRRLVDDIAGKLHRTAAEAQIRQLMPGLNDAYSAMSMDEARALLANVLAIAAQAQMPVPPDLQEQIDPIHNWLTHCQDKAEQAAGFAGACDVLQQGIDTSIPTPRLEQAYREALRFQMELDPQLEARYLRTLHERAGAVRSRRILIFSGITAALLVAGGIATAIIHQTLRAHEARDTELVLRQAATEADAGSVDRARSVVKQVMEQHPRIASDPAIIRSLANFSTTAGAEQQRQDKFRQSMATATAAGLDKPDGAAIKSAESVAKTSDEKQSVAEFKIRIEESARERQAGVDDHFLEAVKTLNDEISQRLTTDSLAAHPNNYQKEVDVFVERAAALGGRAEVSNGLRYSQSRSLLAMLKQKQLAYDEAASERTLLDRVEHVTSAAEKERAIKAYLAKVAESPYAADFRRSARMVPAEQAIEAWCELSRGFDGKLLPGTYQDAAARIALLQKYLKDHPSSPLAKKIETFVEYLNKGLAVASPEGPWKKNYRELLLNPLVHDLHVVQTSEGKRYYVFGDIKLASQRIGDQIKSQDFEAITTSDISRKDKIRLRAPVSIKSDATELSPQGTYSKNALVQIDAMNFGGWETVGTRVLQDLLACKGMDVVLKAILVQNALRLNQPVLEWAGDTSGKTVLDGLAAQNVDDVEWLNPDSPPRPALVATLNQLMSQLPQAAQIDAAVRRRREQAVAALPMGLSAGGILMKPAGMWKVQARGTPSIGAVAYTVGESGSLMAVARYDAKGWVVGSFSAQDVPAGSLLFIVTGLTTPPANVPLRVIARPSSSSAGTVSTGGGK